MRFFAVALFFCGAASYAQSPEVPSKMAFAGMTLTIRDDARREIQLDVDKLTQHKGYYNIKVERAKTYFPLIEKIFEEEGVPTDFKFLVLQESALVSDAVSVSNAVGFWQFKDFTALEMGLRVDKEIDERMNLVSSTRGAAKYLKQSNYQFNNWLMALQAYQMGAGGVRRAMGDDLNGAKKVEITASTYWYVKKYLAHKVAFENATQGTPLTKVIAYEPAARKTIHEIAQDVSADESVLTEYNKWLKCPAIPGDKKYVVIVPVGQLDADFNKLVLTSNRASKAAPLPPKVVAATKNERTVINTIPAVVAGPGESVIAMAARGGVTLSSFLKYNDISIDHVPQAGDSYFLARKKATAEPETYTVKRGDDWWTISQKFGVKLKSLKKFNRVKDESPLPGSLVWMKSARPREEVLPSGDTGVALQLDEESFDWYTKSPKEVTIIRRAPVVEAATPIVLDTATARPTGAEFSKPDYTVKPGDTFYSVARQYGIEVTDLLAMNNLTIQNGLKPGQVLKVVENEPIKNNTVESIPNVSPVIHEVKSSDTLYSIARQYGVTIKDLMDWNHKADFSVSRGEKLEIRQVSR